MSKEVIDEIEDLLIKHKEKLKRLGLKKISQVLEVSFYYWKDHVLTDLDK